VTRASQDGPLGPRAASREPTPDSASVDPDALLERFEAGCSGREDIDMHDVLWAILDDVRDSYSLAMKAAGVADTLVTEIAGTVEDYLANHYGAS
jgi:hypothetical protein